MFHAVPPEHPLVLNRWGRQLNGTILGPMEEGDDIMLTCRVVGGKPKNDIHVTYLTYLRMHIKHEIISIHIFICFVIVFEWYWK